MSRPVATIGPLGEDALIASFEPGEDDLALAAHIRAAAAALRAEAKLPWREIVPAETSLAASFDPLLVDPDAARDALEDALAVDAILDPFADAEPVVLPACYEAPHALDMDRFVSASGLSPEEVTAIHASAIYVVTMIGFTPGFAYMGPVDPRLALPRLSEPRLRVPAGSIGVAGARTGIYALEGPGGWRILGRTPARLFDPQAEDPFRLKAGMRVRFAAVSAQTFDELIQGGRT